MGRTITGEKHLETKLKEILLRGLTEGREISIVIVGCKVSESRLHILEVAATPSHDCNGNVDQWISDHAGQVSSTLPGGIEVLGVAISLKTVQIKAAQPRLRGLLHSVWRESHCGVKQWLDYGGCDLQVLLHYSYESKRLRYQILEVTNSQSALSVASEIKFQSLPHPLIELSTDFTFNCEELCASTDMKTILWKGVQLCSDIVSNSVCTHKGEVPSVNATIDDLSTRNSQAVRVEALYKLPSMSDKLGVTNKGYHMTITDSVQCRAYVTAKTPWHQAIKALKLDALKSLKAREDALLVELEDLESSTGRKHCKLKLPRRVWLRDNMLTWLLCDYSFPNEKEEEAIDNVCKVWGERDIAVCGGEMLRGDKTELPTTTTSNMTQLTPAGRNPSFYVALGSGLVLLVALVIVWLL